MRSANDFQPNREALAALQRTLILLLIDNPTYKQFVVSPQSFADSLSDVPQIYKNAIASVDLNGLSMFRKIVRGTRQERLRQIFLLTTEYISKIAVWDDLINGFLSEVLVSNGRDDSDLDQFVEYVRSNRDVLLGDIVSIDKAMYKASNAPPLQRVHTGPSPGSDLQFQLHPAVQSLETHWPVKEIFSANEKIDPTKPRGVFFTLVYHSAGDSDLQLRQVPEDAFRRLKRKEGITLSELSESPASPQSVRRLIDEGCLVPRS